MNQTASPELAQGGPAYNQTAPAQSASKHEERGRTHGLPFIFWLMEQSKLTLLLFPTVVAAIAAAIADGSWLAFVLAWLAVPVVGVVLPALYLVYRSWQHDAGAAHWEEYVQFKDDKLAAKWKGQKIPMEILYEAYMNEQLEFKQDVYETMLRRNKLFRFAFTWGDVKFYFREFLKQNVEHTIEADEGDIAHVYNRGNDFYHWFLGDSMTYTSGIFEDPDESLESAQERKLDTVCKYVHMQPGDKHLDIGCGWGPLVTHAAKHYGTQSTGITLAEEQAQWARERAEKNGVSDKVKVIVDDYRNLPAEQWDKITCLEMAEHVGIKNFQDFLLQVRSMLKDDGIFYLQIAGLRRPWQYEDLVWGLFMAKYIFPGADASCPLGFVVSQCERAGFEVHRVENCGVHYARTIYKWYENWKSNEQAIVAKYGQRWFRMWMMFLAWSTLIGGQGSSTVFMITLSKNIKNDKSTVSPEEAKDVAYSRAERWIGKNPIATQQ
ncbi:MAG: cyclopropane-fatty-acyl-phospholipid synthase family protein [Myxococcales bacterium]|jgi:cyclopropane fatty-acyl-phospholipid synthase-like methyltransferase